MNDPATKPCPFCGSNAVLFKELIPDCPAGYFMCVDCGAHTGSCIHEAEALIQWNRRPNPETQAVAWLIIHDVGHGLIEKEVVFEPYDESIPLYRSPVEAVPVSALEAFIEREAFVPCDIDGIQEPFMAIRTDELSAFIEEFSK